MIIDSIIVLPRSSIWFNYGENYNDENLFVVNNSYTTLIYENEFTEIWDES